MKGPLRQKWDGNNRMWRQRICGMKYSWKGHNDRNQHMNKIKRSGQARLVYVKDISHNIPTTVIRWQNTSNSKSQVDVQLTMIHDQMTGDKWRWMNHKGRKQISRISRGRQSRQGYILTYSRLSRKPLTDLGSLQSGPQLRCPRYSIVGERLRGGGGRDTQFWRERGVKGERERERKREGGKKEERGRGRERGGERDGERGKREMERNTDGWGERGRRERERDGGKREWERGERVKEREREEESRVRERGKEREREG